MRSVARIWGRAWVARQVAGERLVVRAGAHGHRPAERARGVGIPVRLEVLSVSVTDPEALIAELDPQR